MALPPTSNFTLTHQDGIYEIVFQDMKAVTLDQYFIQLEEIFKHTDVKQTVSLLLQMTSEVPSFQNLASRDRVLRAKLGSVPFVRLAVIYRNQIYQPFLNLMLRAVNINRHMEMQFFAAEQRETARVWLRR